MSFNGRVAIVTTSSSGIGAAVAAALADALPGAMYAGADIADDAACEALVCATIERYGQLDILVNNAGTTEVIAHSDLHAATDEIWQRIFSVNVLGTWHMTRACVPALRATGDGVVVNVSSVAGLRATGSSIPYAVSKTGVNHLTVLLANVLGPEIRVNAVAPGLVDTPWGSSMPATSPVRSSRSTAAWLSGSRRCGMLR
ncbi:MAG TPA: SDR family oxidoreductase [Streptosporangiaceae bacterium]|nr:SDR family oxidoreductase [Streptosporangiaceae bacterium]